jgi:GH18 family chitinase
MGRTVPDFSKISFQRITHLNIAFVNPDSTGNLRLPAGFDSLIQRAHEHQIKILASIGGGSFNPYYSRLLSDTNRKVFVGQLVRLAIDHKLDGLDIDLENDNIDKNYEHFIAGLAAELRPLNKLLTAALATWNAQLITDAALKNFDFINVMSYDQTGPWRPNQPGPHSTYVKAEEDLHYWTTTRGIPKEKLSLGVPFYGYCFGTKYGESMSYRDIITKFPGSDQKDEVAPEGGGKIYYNGLPTIKNKTALALKNAGGVMIWQLLQDAEGDKSLLAAINAKIKESVLRK